MKKNLLFLAASLASFAVSAQNTVYIYSTGPAGSFTTGNSSNTTRTDNNIVATNSGTAVPKRGYAVFDLASLPATAVVNNVNLHYNMAVVTAGGGMGWNTRGYVGDLSTITAAGTLYTTMGLASTIWTTNYPTTPGNTSLNSNGTAVSFVNTNIGSKVSMIWSTNSTRVYTITGESGTATLSGTHAPYLEITYNCPGITSISASGPATPPCPNTAFTLNSAVTGTIASYAWNGPFGFTSTMANPTVTSGLPATGSYTLVVTDASGCTAKTTTLVNVTAAPAPDITAMTSTAFCDGENAVLSAVVPAMDYQWFDGSTAISGATDQTYTTTTSGSYKVQVTDPASGCSAITPVAVPTVLLANPLVSPGSSLLLCVGDNGTISVNTNGVTAGISFQWQKDGVNIPGAGASSYVVSASGVYRSVLTVPATGCTTTSTEIDVLVNDYPLPVVTYSGSSLVTSGTYAHYQWFLNTVAIPGATNATYTPGTTGSYRVRVTDGNGCTAFSPGYLLTGVSVATVATASVKLYPNPVTNMLKIDANGPVNATISTMEGKLVQAVNNASLIDFSSFPAGLYIVTVYNTAGDRIVIEKVVKQ